MLKAFLGTRFNGIFTGRETNGETAFSYTLPTPPGEAAPAPYTCLGAAPPSGWVYNP